jgi:hypothetical protein
MKNKVYIHIGHHLGLMQASSIPTSAPGEEEYISTKSLLELIKSEKERHTARHSIGGIASCNALRELTEKLESL